MEDARKPKKGQVDVTERDFEMFCQDLEDDKDMRNQVGMEHSLI